MKVFIYAIRSNERTVYVGQSLKPHRRLCQLLYKRRVPYRNRKSYNVTILREVKLKEAIRVESQVIKAYWAKGQCEWNKRAKGGQAGHKVGVAVMCITTGREYDSIAAVARHHRCTGGQVLRWLTFRKWEPGEPHLIRLWGPINPHTIGQT